MSILGPSGNPVSSRHFAHAANRNPYRGFPMRSPDAGVDKLIPQADRKTLSALSRRLVFNHGPAKEAIRQKASYSVGSAWMPVYTGSDTEVGEEATSWLENVWYPLCDVRGGGHDWHEFLEVVSKCMDRDGESFVMLTKNDDDFPQLQHIPSYMIWSDPAVKTVKKGTYAGLPIEDGVIMNPKGTRPVAFRVNKDTQGKEFDDISARDLIHTYDSDFPEQRRGFPAFSHALEDIKNSMTSKELELIRQNLISSIFLIETSEDGPDPNDPAFDPSIDTANGEAVLSEQVAPGVRHLRNSQGLTAIKHENPGDVWESFNSRLDDAAIVGAGWAKSMIGKSPGQGTAERADVVRARRAIESRQKRLRYVANRAVTYALAVADQNPRLTATAPGNMLKWKFNLPERLTVDDGREARALQEGVLNGNTSEMEYQAFKGKGYEQHCREQGQAAVIRARVAREISEGNAEGVTIEPDALGAQTASSNTQDNQTP